MTALDGGGVGATRSTGGRASPSAGGGRVRSVGGGSGVGSGVGSGSGAASGMGVGSGSDVVCDSGSGGALCSCSGAPPSAACARDAAASTSGELGTSSGTASTECSDSTAAVGATLKRLGRCQPDPATGSGPCSVTPVGTSNSRHGIRPRDRPTESPTCAHAAPRMSTRIGVSEVSAMAKSGRSPRRSPSASRSGTSPSRAAVSRAARPSSGAATIRWIGPLSTAIQPSWIAVETRGEFIGPTPQFAKRF